MITIRYIILFTMTSFSGINCMNNFSTITVASNTSNTSLSGEGLPEFNTFQLLYTNRDKDLKLIEACSRGNYQLVLYLLSDNAIVNCYTRDSKKGVERSPLKAAIKNKHKEIVQLLLSKGAYPNPIVNNKRILERAVRINDQICLELLKRCSREDVNAKNAQGNTALHSAVKTKNKHLINALIHAGADSTLKNNKNVSPLDYAQSKKWFDIVRLLGNERDQLAVY